MRALDGVTLDVRRARWSRRGTQRRRQVDAAQPRRLRGPAEQRHRERRCNVRRVNDDRLPACDATESNRVPVLQPAAGAAGRGQRRAPARAAAHGALARSTCARGRRSRASGSPEKARSYPAELSGGQLQRVRDRARDRPTVPRSCLPTSRPATSTSATGATVLQLLRDLAGNGQAVLMATHSDDAAAICDRIVHMRDGRIVSSR